jgi:glutaredoxin 3
MQVIVYSTSTCPYCKMLKDFFKEKNIFFIEKTVDLDETAKDEMLASSGGFLGVPFTVIQKDDGSSENVIGFDKGRLEQVLQVKQV